LHANSHADELNALLRGTLYVFDLEDDPEVVQTVSREIRQTHRRIGRFHERVAKATNEARARLGLLQRARLMVESNRIEGIDVDFSDTLAAIEELEGDTSRAAGSLSAAVAGEDKIKKAIGLARAHQLGEELAMGLHRPLTEIDIRGIHKEICIGEPGAGRFRPGDIKIGGARHQPPPEPDMREQLPRLMRWFEENRDGDPLIIAAAGHTWLAHLHPFEDGNGRLSRLLANMALVRKSWPPMVIRSGPSKYEYYSALARSDEAGELLPVISLFLAEVRRSLSEWEAPDEAISAIEAEMVQNRGHEAWCALALQFVDKLSLALRGDGFDVEQVGLPGRADFQYLIDRSPAGNGWLARIRSRGSRAEIPVDMVIFFGFHTADYLRHANYKYIWPSLFFASRNTSPTAMRSYRELRDTDEFALHEVVLKARLAGSVAALRSGPSVAHVSIEGAVELVRAAILAAGSHPIDAESHKRRIAATISRS
jgi:Fic family protein